MLYAEDLAVGQRFELRSHTISEEEILGFVSQYDPVPIVRGSTYTLVLLLVASFLSNFV
jgi:hypothetical protein